MQFNRENKCRWRKTRKSSCYFWLKWILTNDTIIVKFSLTWLTSYHRNSSSSSLVWSMSFHKSWLRNVLYGPLHDIIQKSVNKIVRKSYAIITWYNYKSTCSWEKSGVTIITMSPSLGADKSCAGKLVV